MVAVATYLHPLPVGLHLEDEAGVGFGQSISVRDPFTGEPQLHFGQTGTAEQAQRVGRRLVDVTHGGGGTGSLQGGRKRVVGWIRCVFTGGQWNSVSFRFWCLRWFFFQKSSDGFYLSLQT